MKIIFTVFLFCSLLSLVSSCLKHEGFVIIERQSQVEEPSDECVFVQNDELMQGMIDEKERSIMADCRENRFTTKSEIEANLIGEWKLVGYATFWTQTASMPCSSIIFTNDELTLEYKNAYQDTVITYQYEIVEISTANSNYFRLKTEPEHVHVLFFQIFCEKYIYNDDTPSDGLMHIYEKDN